MSEHPYAVKLYEQYQALWFRVAVQIVRDPDEARDIVQEAYRKFLAAGRDWASLEDARRYFSTILTNTAIDYYKLSRRRLQKHTELGESQEVEDLPAADQPLPWDDLRRKREQRLLEECRQLVWQLPAAQRRAVELLYFNDEPDSLTEASRQAGVPISTLRSRALIGVEKLKKILRKKRLL